MQEVKRIFILLEKTENNLKKGIKIPRESRVDPVITCTHRPGGLPPMCFTASNIQPQQAAGRPAIHALSSASLITKCGLKKDLSRTTQGTASQAPHPSQPPCGDVSVVPLLRLFPAGPASLGSSWRFFKFPSPNALLVGDFERFYSSSAKSSSMNSS